MPAQKDLSPEAQEIERFMAQRERDTAPAWRPEPNTVMAATVVGFRIGRDSGWGEYPIVIYKLDSGELVAVHAFHTLLRDQLKELGTKPGLRQILFYGGVATKVRATDDDREKGRDKYHDYYVRNADSIGEEAGMLQELPEF